MAAITNLGSNLHALAIIAGLALVLYGTIILLPLHSQKPARHRIVRRASNVAKSTAAPSATAMVLGPDEEWRRVSAIISTATETASQVRHLQKSASGHLDAANYALQEMLFELEKVMPVAYQKVPSGFQRIEPAPRRERDLRPLAA